MIDIPDDVGTGWRLNKSTCPECGDMLDAATKAVGEEGAPEPGALAICAHCYAVNQYVEGEVKGDLELAPFDVTQLELEQRKEIQAMRIWLASRPDPE